MDCFNDHALAAFYTDALVVSPPQSGLLLPLLIAICALVIAGYAQRQSLVDVNDNNNTIAKAAIPAFLQAPSILDVETQAVWDDMTKLYNDEIATPSPYNLATSDGNWCEEQRDDQMNISFDPTAPIATPLTKGRRLHKELESSLDGGYWAMSSAARRR